MEFPVGFYMIVLMKILGILFFVCSVMLAVWAFFIEPSLLHVRFYKVSCPSLGGMRLVFASDFHFGRTHSKRAEKIVAEINRQKADVVLLGGDYLKGHKPESFMPVGDIARALGKIRAPGGVFGVLGNHDLFTDKDRLIEAFRREGINLLQNENRFVSVGKRGFYVAGIEDMYTQRPNLKKTLPETEYPVILLSHEPDIYRDVPEKVLLTLSGHMHGGQLRLPFFGALIVPSPMGRKYAQGYFEENGKKMIVSSGLGTSLLPFRLNAVPEIVVVDFE